MAVGAAWASIGGALALGHADAVYVKIGNVFGHVLALIGSNRKAANSKGKLGVVTLRLGDNPVKMAGVRLSCAFRFEVSASLGFDRDREAVSDRENGDKQFAASVQQPIQLLNRFRRGLVGIFLRHFATPQHVVGDKEASLAKLWQCEA